MAPRAEIAPQELGSPATSTEAGTLISDLRNLRDALRHLAAEATDDPRPRRRSGPRPSAARAAAVSTINQAAAAPAWAALSWPDHGPATCQRRSWGPAARTLLSAIAGQAISLFAGPSQPGQPGQPGQPRLRACLGPGCVLYFVQQHPRREWCSAGCGNRARVARHYHRHRGPAAG